MPFALKCLRRHTCTFAPTLIYPTHAAVLWLALLPRVQLSLREFVFWCGVVTIFLLLCTCSIVFVQICRICRAKRKSKKRRKRRNQMVGLFACIHPHVLAWLWAHGRGNYAPYPSGAFLLERWSILSWLGMLPDDIAGIPKNWKLKSLSKVWYRKAIVVQEISPVLRIRFLFQVLGSDTQYTDRTHCHRFSA